MPVSSLIRSRRHIFEAIDSNAICQTRWGSRMDVKWNLNDIMEQTIKSVKNYGLNKISHEVTRVYGHDHRHEY